MAINTQRPTITADDLLKPEFNRIELINGAKVEKMAASGRHNIIAGNIFSIIRAYVLTHKLGAIFTDNLHYLMFSQTTGVKDSLLPDASFIRKNDIIAEWNIDSPYPGAPTLAIEVISDSESPDSIGSKVRIYLEKGTEQVWVIYPSSQEVHQYINGDETKFATYSGSAQLNVDALFPGLTLTTDQIFAMPDWVTNAPEDTPAQNDET
jgi:Uma2 family endonuclease